MRKSLFCRLLMLACLITPTMPCASLADVVAPEVDALLANSRINNEIPVIITRKGGIDVRNLRASNQALLRSAIVTSLRDQAETNLVPLIVFLEKSGAQRVRELWMTNSVAAIVDGSTVEKLRSYPGISIVRLDDMIQLPETLTAVASPVEWNIAAVGASDLWTLGYTGADVVVADMDSGVDINHADLIDRWRGGTNSWYDPNGEHPLTPTDKNGHGTAVMSVMVGGDATGSSIGVAPGARWIAVKIFNDDGLSENSAIHLGFQWLLDPDGDPNTDDAPDVVNNSWGFRDLIDRCYLEFQTDIQILKTAGVAVIFSAGNEGPNPSTSISPANNPESFAVGSVDSGFAIATTSSRGPSACILDNDIFPEAVAPGVDIKAADLTFNGLVPDAYAYYDGTSFSAPHVAGGMALLMNAFPGRDLTELESALTSSTIDLGPEGPDDDYGYGMVNFLAAYRTLLPCTDADADGYYAEAVCATSQDCNDEDPSISPGALEIKHDGIDQDCNGYDLTIDIVSTIYRPGKDELIVIATSELNGGAGLQVDGFGAMAWNGPDKLWELAVTAAGGDPERVVVSGREGSESSSTTVCADVDGDGFFTDEICGTATDCNDEDAEIHPGAPEIKNDTIDQDCNGYDLTIEIIRANYHSVDDRLVVYATTALNESAELELLGYGSMLWVAERQRWEGIFSNVGGNPIEIIVSGIEGAESRMTCQDPCLSDLNGDGVVNISDFGILSAAFGSREGDNTWNPIADINIDGVVNISDFGILSSEFGSTDCPDCN